MRYKGYVKGDVVILKNRLSVPDGTEVEIFIPSAKGEKREGQAKLSVAEETFGMIRSDPALVRTVLEEDLYEA
jgi:hypothetical protein